MDWSSEGLIIGVRRYGESSVIVEAMTAERGRHLGLVRGGRSRKNAATLQPGNHVSLRWRARLEEHLGAFSVELVRGRAAALISNRQHLYVAQTLFAHLRLLPERDPHARLLGFTEEILDTDSEFVQRAQMLALFELSLLDELGFGLDIAACALTGETRGLTHVSPKTGRAVTQEAGAAYVDRLLRLPQFFRGNQPATAKECLEGLKLTGHFLHRHVWSVRDTDPPPTRDQLLVELQQGL
jgi:DNA repair protein RecO (recombination protein O)